MFLFKCILTNKSGYIEEFFYREGESASSVLEGLLSFCWPKGVWSIEGCDYERTGL